MSWSSGTPSSVSAHAMWTWPTGSIPSHGDLVGRLVSPAVEAVEWQNRVGGLEVAVAERANRDHESRKPEEREGAVLVERLVQVAALGRLDARRAEGFWHGQPSIIFAVSATQPSNIS